MTTVSAADLDTILLGIEHGGDPGAVYKASFAVPGSILGSSFSNNNSAFSFGVTQLDIGGNALAQQAYAAILDSSLASGAIDQTQHDRLLSYEGKTRYDLDAALGTTYEADQALLDTKVFTQQAVKDIVDQYDQLYISQNLLGTVQGFIDAMTATWGNNSVFDYDSPDFHTAVAAMTLIASRFGQLTQATAYFQASQPTTIDDVRAQFNALLPATNVNDWQLVQAGANLFNQADIRYHGVPDTTPLSAATGLLGVPNSDNAMSLFLKSEVGNSISSVKYTGSNDAAFLVGHFAIPGVFDLNGGIFLSSGGFPGPVNTSPSFSTVNGTPGDADLSATASAAFSGAGATYDASVLTFTLNIVGQVIDGISFNIAFGSDEYPEFSNTSYVDVAAIYVNGQNVALFNDNPLTPLSVIQANVTAGNFLDNTTGQYATEWDGFSKILAVRAPLHEGQNTIKIGIADTGDAIYDSGLYVSNIKYLTQGGVGGGVLQIINEGPGDHVIVAGPNREEIDLGDGANTVSGTPANLNGDIITGFGADDKLVFDGVLFSLGDISVVSGSGTLRIDTNQDGIPDTTVTLEGTFPGAQFNVNQVDGNSVVTVTGMTPPTPPVYSISAADVTKPEGESTSTAFTFTVARSGDTSAAASLTYAVTGSGGNPATANDFSGGVLPTGSVAFAAGDTFSVITIMVNGNTLAKSDESFTVTLSGPTGTGISVPTATGLIHNSDTTTVTQTPPTIGAVIPGMVESGQAAVVGTVAPGLAEDTLTLTQTAGAGTLALGMAQADGTRQVIYTAPASIAASTTDAVGYIVTENGDSATGSADVQWDTGPSVTLLPFELPSQDTPLTIATASPGLPNDTLSLVILQSPQNGILSLQGNAIQYAGDINALSEPMTFSFALQDQLGGVTPTENIIIANNTSSGVTGNTDISLGGGINTVTLAGDNNALNAGPGSNTVAGGVSNNTIVLGGGANDVTLDGGNNTVSLGDGLNKVSVGGTGNQIKLGSGNAVIHGGTCDTITLNGDGSSLSLYGTNEMVFLNGSGASIDDLSQGMSLALNGAPGEVMLSNFLQDASGVIDLPGGLGGFASTQDVVAALQSDNNGGTQLSFGPSGSLDFLNVTPDQFSAKQFAIS